ncbi:uncharacterized protein LOC122210896 isoform X1 [Panthera leo]|uniref:uncharacterized protein LOC122210896 isoform X1 n=1 Tax=Panthera leo TaxID=9689 RepID=UPI001C6A3B0E|nr:uncharacterized protein LOC122210896 isoform X1 [Panthera leo]XP_042779774.1 uncharacterized protein LOC122210896 isoform X1 [Panthera leo]XP_042779775.1 uncharacterized protein LOC122210896 isoform X1 [Panthera leo]
MILFALLLVTDLPRVETNVTVSGKQAATLKCHVCEIENSFGCTNPSNCPRDFHFCTSVAVRIYPRFFYVSKQCSRYCPVKKFQLRSRQKHPRWEGIISSRPGPGGKGGHCGSYKKPTIPATQPMSILRHPESLLFSGGPSFRTTHPLPPSSP